MIDSKDSTESSPFKTFALAVAAVAICALLMGVADVLAPAAATSQVSATATYAGPSGYFPDEYVNQAKEIEPMPAEYY